MSRALGRYELVRPLARGGMAEVYLARRRAGGIEKLLVIKRIRRERATDARFLELFLREARLSMGLTHQNIVPVFDFGRSGDQVFLAMERVEGRDLGSSLAQAGPTRPLPPLVAAFIAAECCQALAYAHARRGSDGALLGIVHRDVTPRNVLVSWSGEVKLTDFGIAGLADDAPGHLAGTPAYMAPEQARGEPTDPRTDVYALGLVVREAVTGVRVRPGDARAEVVEVARAGTLPPWPPGVPAPLMAIIGRATAATPATRYPDCGAMLAALDGYMVATRATTAGDPPAQQLAGWMAATWGPAAGDDDAAPAALEEPAAPLVSFLDDGELGTGTARSMLATEDAPVAPTAEASAPPPGSPAAAALTDRAGVAAEPARPPPSRRAALVVGALAVGGMAVGGWVVLGAGRRAAPVRSDAAAPLDASPPDAPPLDDAPLDAAPLDAAPLDGPPPDAAPLDARPRDPTPPPPPAPRDAGPRPLDASTPAPATRRVRVNARPWATVYVDGSADGHDTIATFALTPGRHRLRFVNPPLGVDREVDIVVPADRDLDHVEDLRR
ncbi:MAG: protein kinase [Kofleriaceae bacterium]